VFILDSGERTMILMRIGVRLWLSALVLQFLFNEANAEHYNCNVPRALAKLSLNIPTSDSTDIDATPITGGSIIDRWSIKRMKGRVRYIAGHQYGEVEGAEAKIIKMKNGDVAVQLDSESSSKESDGRTQTSYFVFCRDQTFLTTTVTFGKPRTEALDFADDLKKQIMTDPRLAPFIAEMQVR
jgi:hypothetical protein